jgi:hydrogenase expression/formation protein HypC
MGHADFGGVARSVCLAYTPQAAVGDYILVHVGFALSVISQEEAQETLRLLDEVNGVGP